MATFHYTALTADGALTRGEHVATSIAALRADLAGRGFLLQDARTKTQLLPQLRRTSTGLDELLLFNQELTALLRAGLTIPDTLAICADRPERSRLALALQRVLDEVRGGAGFSEACARQEGVFDPLFIAALRTGEKTGDIVSSLTHFQDYLKQRVALRKKVGQALAYPIFLVATMVVILLVLFIFVLPRFVAIYSDFNAELPWMTRWLIALVEAMPVLLPLTAGAAVLCWLGYRQVTKTAAGRLRLDRIKERIPWFGSLRRTLGIAQLTRSLSTLLASGTPLVEAMRTTQGSLPSAADGERLGQAVQQVSEGKSLAEAVSNAGLLPVTARKMVEVGEASGRLDTMLLEIAQYYEGILDNRLTRMMSLIEPALMLLIGVFVGGIIITMYLPIFSLADVIH